MHNLPPRKSKRPIPPPTETPHEGVKGKCKYRAYHTFTHICSISSAEIECDVCMSNRNLGPRICPVGGCHPQPGNIQDSLEVGSGGYWKEHPERFPKDVIYSGCRYYEKCGRSSGGGNSLVAVR